MSPVAAARPAVLTPRLVDALYTEALVLADEAHWYFDGAGRGERDGLPAADRVAFSCEALRVTTRLMHVIAWLLTRRAVSAGEVSAQQGASPDRRLGDVADSDAEAVTRLPETARAIVAAASDLHTRVRRLDEGLEEALPAANPVSGLWAKLERAF